MADLPTKKISQIPLADSFGDSDVIVGNVAGVTKRIAGSLLRGKLATASLRAFGASMDGTTNDYAALSACLAAGKIPVFDGPCKVVLPDAAATVSVLQSLNSWQLLGRVSLVVPSINSISAAKALDLNNPTLGNLSISGTTVDLGAVTALLSTGGSAKAWTFQATVAASLGAVVGDYLFLRGGTGWTEWDAFVLGAWKITNVAGNVISFTTANAFPSLPVSPISTAGLLARVSKSVVRFPKGSIGIRLNGAIFGSIKDLTIAGRFVIATETAYDGKGDGLQVGGAADTFNTGLNESEQINLGACWAQRLAIVEFDGNGTQTFGGRLYGSELYTCANAWRGDQSAGTGHNLVKGIISSGNGASGGESEAMGNKDCDNGWFIGNQQQGLYAIGNSLCGGGFVSMFNVGNQVDARNGGQIIADGATISGTNAIYCNGGRVVAGAGAKIDGALTIDELGRVIGKGADHITGAVSLEPGSTFQMPDGTLYNATPNENRLLYNASWQYRVQMSSIGDISYQIAAAGSSTWTTYASTKNGSGDFRPSLTTSDLGDTTNPWRYFRGQNVVLKPAASVTPANNGEVMLQLTSNTSLTFKVNGSDGVVRSASLTLA